MSKVKRLSGLLRRSWYGGINVVQSYNWPQNPSPPPSPTTRRRPKRPVLVSDVLKEIFAFIALPNDQQPFGNLDKKTYKTLHSCLLVNRQWCQVAAQFLWRQPFFTRHIPAQITMMELLLNALNPKLQQYLINKGITIRRLKSAPAFDYSYFIKHIDFELFIDMVRNWSAATFRGASAKDASFLVAKVVLGHIFSYSPGIERLRLSCFQGHSETSHYYEILLEPEIHINLLQLKYLELSGQFYREDNILAGLSISCKNVEYLQLGNWCLDSWCRSPESLSEDITALFKGLKNVEHLEIDSDNSFFPIPICVIDAFKHISSSLRHLRFRCIDFSSKTCMPLEGLATCRKLETLEFVDCEQVGKRLLQPLNAESLPNLQRVRIDGCSERDIVFWDWVDLVNGRRRSI
ncbi:124_t:CDS:2 [Ambispora leptoticha]|uniref:124_t:CDS:1 n=1 Tax=Ambispora leptoticha TaxID=144679 RepID=A0A9N8YXS9_9GLOM|nr:124_t:CDS:2 [Ambispora leptoticha]